MNGRTGTDNVTSGGGESSLRLPDLYSVFYLAAIFTALLVLVPILYLAVRAAGSEGAFTDLVSRPRTWEILKRSILLSFSVTFISALVSVPLAWILERTDLPLKRVWTVLTTVPVVIPSYVAGFVTVAALGPRGLVQQLLEPFGVDRLPEIYGFWGALLTLTLVRYPYVLLPVRAALSRMDPSLEESSRSLGKTPFQTFVKIILPQMRPALVAGCLLTALTALADFGAVSLLRYETFTWAIYIQYQSLFDRSAAASLSLVLVAFALSLLMLEWLTEKKAPTYSASRGNRPPLQPIRLGKWKAPALSLCTVITLGSIVVPVSILGMWLVRGIVSGEIMPGLAEPLFNSVYISAMGALATVLLAFPVAWLAVMKRSRLTSVLERVSYLGFALPGIVIGLALVFFGIRYLAPVYQTRTMLVAAYVILFLPMALGPLRTSFLQLSPRLGEAARSLGKSQSAVMARITIPLSVPGIVTGTLLTFLVTMRELPATLILSPIGFRTLATSTWSASSEAFFAQAALYSLVLIAISSVPMAILILKRKNGGYA
ncbi:MAG TPA: iron ABC transporter permease [Thermodesulfobacteriota bacterium]|nr:iron ABC transporter permease [Thermodesulfobacteriota bacterium]